MHERLRLEMQRRIQRGSLSVSLLARQTGFGQAHLSLFLNAKRRLSMAGLDRVLTAQRLEPEDLLPSRVSVHTAESEDRLWVPLVSHATAMFERWVRPGSRQALVYVPGRVLGEARSQASQSRKTWMRFVAVQAPAMEVTPMDPVVLAEAVVVLDRHYNALQQYHPARPNLYAVRQDGRLKIRYADFQAGRLVLRPYRQTAPVELIDLGPGETPGDLIVGRVVLVMNPM